MKILWLSHSNHDTSRPGVRAGRRRPDLMASALAAAIGEPVDVVMKPIWPAEALPGIVERRRGEGRPGGLGRGMGGGGFGAADRLGEHRMFRWARTLLQVTIGGDTHFTPQQVL